ncbi:hypothetical protein [Terribacillus saccharophilus]|uniref:hypothetical protein n=1 Tax=Terribacillus saccharophilus TaxID=361277 RepID=UPI000C9AB6A3|nr:hypothetical protein [Terribacillus goriensis]
MEKVKVTREQADAIDFAINGPSDLLYHNNPDELLSGCAKDWEFGGQLEALNSMSIVTIAKALYIGYEIEGFKVGDWVVITTGVNKDFNQTKKITDIQKSFASGHSVVYQLNSEGAYYDNEIRYATPEEIEAEKNRRRWATIGRNVNEYKVGDIVTTGSLTRPIESIENHLILEHLGEYSNEEVFMVCPVEQRLDMVNES